MKNDEILNRVLFEVLLHAGENTAAELIDAAVKREDVQSAGGVPNLDRDIGRVKKLVVVRYRAARKERGLVK